LAQGIHVCTGNHYMKKLSASTRNPHSARKPPIELKVLLSKKYDERVRLQWQASSGCPISDEAKAAFIINHVHKEKPCQYQLADIRIWSRPISSADNISLELFFDGLPLQEERRFMQMFEAKLEAVLKEKRMLNIKEKQGVKRRHAVTSEEGESEVELTTKFADSEFPDTQLKVESFREAGCMLHFIVVQTTISIDAAETLGQLVFPEHFPVEGLGQYVEKSVPWRDMPCWFWFLVFLLGITLIATVVAWGNAYIEIAARTGKVHMGM